MINRTRKQLFSVAMESANTFDQKTFHSTVDGDLKEMVDALANGSRVTFGQSLQLKPD